MENTIKMLAEQAPVGYVFYSSVSTNNKPKKFWLADWSQYLSGYRDLLDENGNLSITVSPGRSVYVIHEKR